MKNANTQPKTKTVTMYSADNYDDMQEAAECCAVRVSTVPADTSNDVILAMAALASNALGLSDTAICVMVDGVELEWC